MCADGPVGWNEGKGGDHEEEHLEELVRASREGDRKAWGELWLAVTPLLETIAGRFRCSGRLARSEDARRDIVTSVMAALRADGDRRLSELGELLARRDGSYRRWLSRVAINEALQHVRRHPEYLGKGNGEASRWVRFAPIEGEEALAGDGPSPRAIEDEVDARLILSRAQGKLRPEQLAALYRWTQQDDFEEIAEALHLADADEGKRLVRSAVAQLRARYADAREELPGQEKVEERLTDRPAKASRRR